MTAVNINDSKRFFCSVDIEISGGYYNKEIVQIAFYPEGDYDPLCVYVMPSFDVSGRCANKIKVISVGNKRRMYQNNIEILSYAKIEAKKIITNYIESLVLISKSLNKELFLLSHNALTDYVYISSLLNYEIFDANVLCTFKTAKQYNISDCSNVHLYSYYTGLDPLEAHDALNDAYMNLVWFSKYVESSKPVHKPHLFDFLFGKIINYIKDECKCTYKEMMQYQLKLTNSRYIRGNGLEQVTSNPHNKPNSTFTLHHSTVRALSNKGITAEMLIDYCSKGLIYLSESLKQLGYKGKKIIDIYRSVNENSKTEILTHCNIPLRRCKTKNSYYFLCTECSFKYQMSSDLV